MLGIPFIGQIQYIVDSLTRKLGRVIVMDDSERVIEIDSFYPAIVQIDIKHHMIHEGLSFYVTNTQLGVVASTWQNWLITTPVGTRAHLVFDCESTQTGLISIYENPTLTTNGAALTEFNSDRNSLIASTLNTFVNPTFSSVGTNIYNQVVGPNGIVNFGGEGGSRQEIILKENEDYIFRFFPDSLSNINIRLFWYELI